jgi:hypothetical protein
LHSIWCMYVDFWLFLLSKFFLYVFISARGVTIRIRIVNGGQCPQSLETKKKSQQQNFAKRSKNINLIVDVYVLFKCPAIHRGTQLFLRGPLNTRESRFTPKKKYNSLLNHMFLLYIKCSFPFIATSSHSLSRTPLTEKKRSWRHGVMSRKCMPLWFSLSLVCESFLNSLQKKNAVMPFAL